MANPSIALENIQPTRIIGSGDNLTKLLRGDGEWVDGVAYTKNFYTIVNGVTSEYATITEAINDNVFSVRLAKDVTITSSKNINSPFTIYGNGFVLAFDIEFYFSSIVKFIDIKIAGNGVLMLTGSVSIYNTNLANVVINALNVNNAINVLNGSSIEDSNFSNCRVNLFDTSRITSCTGDNNSQIYKDSTCIVNNISNFTLNVETALSTTGGTVRGATEFLAPIAITGTEGTGFIGYIAQSPAPSTPTDGFRFYADASNRFTWKGTNGFTRTFDGILNTADRVYTLPDTSGTIALASLKQDTLVSATNIKSINGSSILGAGDLTVTGITDATLASTITGATSKAIPVDADQISITDSASSFSLKKLTWANLKAALSNLFLNKSGDIITGNIGNTSTGFFRIASGSNAARPVTPLDGMIRYNTDTLRTEFYSNSAWRNMARLEGDTLTGTAGTGFIGYISQSTAPSTPTNGFRFYADASSRFAWKGTNGFTRTFDGILNTADRVYTLPDTSGTIALVSDIAKYDPTFATYSIASSITTIATSGKFVNNGNLILTGNTNLTFTGLVSGASGIIVITKDNSNTTYTITQTIFTNIGTFKPSATANTVTELSWIYNGSAILWTARYY